MERLLLRDDQWVRLEPLCAGKQSDRGVTANDNRLFIEAVLWIARTGSPRWDMSTTFWNWHSVYVRFARWKDYFCWNVNQGCLHSFLGHFHLW
jgi:transposase